jgi:HEAT repeat protein
MQKGAIGVKKIILIAVCFLLFQTVSLADESKSKNSSLQKKDLPRTFLMGIESKVIINKKGESVFLVSSGSTLEEILQKFAEEKQVILNFYCSDPSLNQERRPDLRISADSLVKALQRLLPEDCRFSSLNRDGQETKSSKDIAALNIYPKQCGTDRPVRVFVSGRAQNWQTRRPEEISLEELNDAMKRQGPSSRRWALDILGIKGDEKGIPYAKEALKDANTGVMFAAADALNRLGQKFGPEKVSDAIYERFLEKPYPEFLPIMAQVDKDKFFAVIEGLEDQGGAKEQQILTRALALTKDRRAIKYLSRFVSAGNMANSRQAIYAIGDIGGPEAASILVRLLRDGNADQQAAAVQAAYFLPQGEGADVRAEVEKIVKEDRVSDPALRAMAMVSYYEPLEKLMKDPASKPDLKVRALKAMTKQGSEKMIRIMSMGLNDEALQVRIASVEAMGFVGLDPAIPYLVKATEDKDAKVREAAVNVLADFPGDDNVSKALGKALHDADEKVRRSAVDSLSLLGKPDEKLIETLADCEKNHKDPYVANKAGSILKSWNLK